jgi:hypothetical protein
VEDDQPNRDEPPPKETAEFPRPAADETSVLPAAQEPGQPPARWSARAGIPVRNQEPEPGWVREEGPPRTWWAPVVIVVAIVVLLGLIGLGLWLAMKGQPTPVPSPSVVPSSAVSSASPTQSPTPTASPTPTVTMVPVPVLRGATVNDAQQALQAQGLNSTVVNRVSDQPAGTVIDTDPPAGTQVPAGTEVTLFVATPPPSSANPEPSNP